MGTTTSNILSKKGTVEILVYLLEHGISKKTDLQKVATMHTIEGLLPDLEFNGLLTVKEEFPGRRTYVIALTDTGKYVAETLRNAVLVTKGELSENEAIEMRPDWKDRFKGLSAMTHLNVLDDHVAIQEIDSSGKTTSVVMVYVKRINSHFELWCEKDESKECKHVDFAWSLPQMRALIEKYIKEGKIKEVGRVG